MTQLPLNLGTSGASFSPCRRYRYALWRRWADGPQCLFLMLNGSKANELASDNTVTRCLNYAKAWRYGCLAVCNLYGLMSTDPRMLAKVEDPIGPENDWYIRDTAEHSGIVVCGWGAEPFAINRAKDVVKLLAGVPLYCLERTKMGHPRHPLYCKASLVPTPFSFEENPCPKST